mmetsp:Transcript_48447/g.142999  ORF Transcript_48447/g.142999 Transcript_48447/m.142999 type:complete len:219 (-) Transcript_48447:827-1483(-)
MESWYFTYRRMRNESSDETSFARRYRRRRERFLSNMELIWRSCVIAPVMLERKEEKTSRAKHSTTTEKARSQLLVGKTSMDAGVNCVRDQCMLVRYLYWMSSRSSKCPAAVQLRSPGERFAEPMACHVQATRWLRTRTKPISWTMWMHTFTYSEAMLSTMSSMIFWSLASLSRRSALMMRRIRMVRAMDKAPQVFSCQMTTSQSEETRVTSSSSHVRR